MHKIEMHNCTIAQLSILKWLTFFTALVAAFLR